MSRTDKDRPGRLRENEPPTLGRAYFRYWRYNVPNWYINHFWNGPQRLHVRDTLRGAVQDYNANGETDIETVNVQHRHCAEFWYW